MIKVYAAMSGGVDSSTAAQLLINEGYFVEGVTLKLQPSGQEGDIADARAVCDTLGIAHHVFDWVDDFDKLVISRWVDTYLEAKTPNPCIFCNASIKFGKLIDTATANGFDKVATGHYAQIEEKGGRFLLKKSACEEKDQSYVLYGLTQFQLSHTLFPLGKTSKSDARKIAKDGGLQVADKGESQDICFVKNGGYADFIAARTGKAPVTGDFVTEDGRVLGKHKGLINYTIGQRKGLGLALPAPLYVLRLDSKKNEVVLSPEERLFGTVLTAKDVNFIPFDTLDAPIKVAAKIRYRHAAQPATVYPIENNKIKVVFDSPQRAITAGQSVVLYDGDYVVGGGIIE